MIAAPNTLREHLMNHARICLARHGQTDWNKRGILRWLRSQKGGKGVCVRVEDG
jgi:hypothetical protein